MATTIPLYRLYHEGVGDHFYTTSEDERESARKEGYNYEGVACRVLPVGDPAGVPLYRMFHAASGDHFYTTSAEERDNAIQNLKYNDEGVACHVLSGGEVGEIAFYRAYNPQIVDHFYTTSSAEWERAVQTLGYQNEGVACHVYPVAEQPPEPVEPTKPIDIIRWPNLEHRFSAGSPLHVNVASPIHVGVTTPVHLGFTDTPANVNMNIVTPNAVGVNILGSKEPVALRFVITEPIIATSDYNIQLRVNGNEILSVQIGGTTEITSAAPRLDLNLGTGVNPDWRLVEAPPGVPLGPVRVGRGAGTWTDVPGADWLWPQNSEQAAGLYVFELVFRLRYAFTAAQGEIRLRTDNDGELFLNNLSLAKTPPGSFHPTDGSLTVVTLNAEQLGALVVGENRIRVNIQNLQTPTGPGPAGLALAGKLTATEGRVP